LGGSGTGKSVLLKLIIGLLKPDTGQILVEGEDIVPLQEEELLQVRRKVGMLFQGAALFDSLSVRENVAFPLREHTRMTEAEIRGRVEEVLALVGMAGVEEKLPSELSGGMRKRVGLARAIALTPRIVLYDEPTTGLDPRNVDKINELITDLRAKLQVTSVVVTHDIQSALRISDRVALLSDGRVVDTGTPAEIAKAEHPVVQEFLAGHL
ncbi:MAG: ABC transporter ATP-binding protein, partial [Candidatus Methylomirabilales bacterium]